MTATDLQEHFFGLLPPPLPNAWEIAEHLEPLAELPAPQQEIILAQVPAIWPVSHSLCYSYLFFAGPALACLDKHQVREWVASTLDIYESKGLREAQEFMADVENNFLCHLRGETGMLFNQAETRLAAYARGIAGQEITLAPGPAVYTDSETIFLPRELTLFRDREDNFLFYKLIVTFQLALLHCRTYDPGWLAAGSPLAEVQAKYRLPLPAAPGRLADFFKMFPAPGLAEDIFTLLEGLRITDYLSTVFPGLWRDSAGLRAMLADRRQPPAMAGPPRVLAALYGFALRGTPAVAGLAPAEAALFHGALAELQQPGQTPAASAAGTLRIYELLTDRLEPAPQNSWLPMEPLPYLGRLRPAEYLKILARKRAEAKEGFIQALAAVLARGRATSADDEDGTDQAKPPAPKTSGPAGTALINPAGRHQASQTDPPPAAPDIPRFLMVNGLELELPVELRAAAEKIIEDIGCLPEEYIAAAQGMAGRALPTRRAASKPAGESLIAPISYDEWDFRRNGFRKDWCALAQKKIVPVKGTFVKNTLEKYHGLLLKLKKQFELLRSQERFARRQRDGDDIDLDALVEAIADSRAGQPASERLFVRLLRDQRNIAVIFLVDMSLSTEGWISQTLKEALLLMGEALEVLGDRFAIHGFSGMRRTRSDFYHVKSFNEPYDQEAKNRIAAITPQEYTRMGPPIRHAVSLLQDVEARLRLLIVLSDGKPEDYDDYKGEYAIEDTRHALIEAKAAGIHPFCITIDHQAHDYIGHMYGAVNYIWMNDLTKLPARLPEIYRTLTT